MAATKILTKLKYKSLFDLAELPYFHLKEEGGAKHLTLDPEVGPIIDGHAHIAMAFFFPMQLDLQKETPETHYYLDPHGPLRLDCYTSQNFDRSRLNLMKRDLGFMSLTGGGLRATHTAANLVRDMKNMLVEHTLVLAIELPFISDNSKTNQEALDKYPGLFTRYGSVHPATPNLEKQLDRLVELGCKGVKIHPGVQSIRPDYRRAIRLYKMCGERDLPVFWHCGPVNIEPYPGRKCSQVKYYWKPVRECPETTFILGHSGALQVKEGVAIANKYPNVYLELVCQALENMVYIFDNADPDRIIYGSDWPFYHQAVTLVKVLLATEGRPELRRKIIYDNAARLFGLDKKEG